MNKIMALDVGTKRIGIALSDYLHVIATPHTTIPRTPEQDAIESILKIAKENNVKTIIDIILILDKEINKFKN